MMRATGESPAKINLTLRVGSVRADGFHEIESLVARVGLCDTVSISLRPDRRFTLACDDPSIPEGEDNLALRAARRLAEVAGVRDRGIHITLEKRIPPGAGLGGGSSDAATVLGLCNGLWETGVSRDELASIGAEIGSDVPLFFHTPLCVVRGRGERVEDLPRRLTGWVALVLPGIHVSTPDVYAAWDRLDSSRRRRPVDEIVKSFGLVGVGEAGDLAPVVAGRLMAHLFNDLEEPALSVCDELAGLVERLRRGTGEPVCMTGSGSGLFGLFDDRGAAQAQADLFARDLTVEACVVPLLTD